MTRFANPLILESANGLARSAARLIAPGVVVIALSAPSPVLAQQDGTPQTHSVFGTLLTVVENVAPSQQEWEKLLTEQGFSGASGSGEFWTKKDSVGEVRVSAFFNANETSYFLLYFPIDARPLPDALLAHLLKSSSAQVREGDAIEIALPTQGLSGTGCRGTRGEYLLIRLTGGALLRTSVTVNCKGPRGN